MTPEPNVAAHIGTCWQGQIPLCPVSLDSLHHFRTLGPTRGACSFCGLPRPLDFCGLDACRCACHIKEAP